MKKQFRNFNDTRKFVHSLKLKKWSDWLVFCKSGNKPHDIPSNVNTAYKNNGWISWGDFLGTGTIASYKKRYRTFDEAKKFAQSLNLKQRKDWTEYCKSGNKPEDIPTAPEIVYKRQWKGVGDWLGTGTLHPRDRSYLPILESKRIIQKYGLKSKREWIELKKLNKFPKNIPRDPPSVYAKKGWIGWGDFLGSNVIQPQKKQFRLFNDARDFAHTLNLSSGNEWIQYCKSGKNPKDIPADVVGVYKKEWKNWGDFLGTGNISPTAISKNYLSFKEARTETRKLAKKHNLKTFDDWKKAVREGKIPKNIPLKPDRVYSKKRKKK